MLSFDCRQSAARQPLRESQSRRFERSAQPRQKAGGFLQGTVLGEPSFHHCTYPHCRGNKGRRGKQAAFLKSRVSKALATIDLLHVVGSL